MEARTLARLRSEFQYVGSSLAKGTYGLTFLEAADVSRTYLYEYGCFAYSPGVTMLWGHRNMLGLRREFFLVNRGRRVDTQDYMNVDDFFHSPEKQLLWDEL